MDDVVSTDVNLTQLAGKIADHEQLPAQGVRAALDLLTNGNTLPFIARYRKELTEGLDERSLRLIEDGLERASELAKRKASILRSIKQQGLLTVELRGRIANCDDKHILEDLYLPFKPKRRTRAALARERGLAALAELLLEQKPLNKSRQMVLRPFIAPKNDVPDADAALSGALDIVAEQWSEDPDMRAWLADQARNYGKLHSRVKRGKKTEAAKYEPYFDHTERVKSAAGHRILAVHRGQSEGFLRIDLELNDELILRHLRRHWVPHSRFEFRAELQRTVDDCYQRLLLPPTETALLQQLKERAETEAIQVFAKNLRELLLAPPAGARVTMGIDPGFRTGCKVAIVDVTGKFLESRTIYPTLPRADVAGATATIHELMHRHGVELIAIGNGTASRETDAFVASVLREATDEETKPTKVVVNESGASIYSASELAINEYPDLDVTVRGAISIAHRLQDPLAELVKIDPKSIGVGQYQHDVNQLHLRRSLDREVGSCVNLVGVDVNMASRALLAHVSGIGDRLAERIVEYRNVHGRFDTREELLKVPKLGPKAFEQAAGFMRIRNGSQPLDNSAVHPESYHVVEKMATALGVSTEVLVGNSTLAAQLRVDDFVDTHAGMATIQDIVAEITKPGRDPRRDFKSARFADNVNCLEDLKRGMSLEGVITNVTQFGAFIDLGVHQDGLIHVSELADQYVHDPAEIVSVGDVVRVKVLDVDLERRRISVSRKQA